MADAGDFRKAAQEALLLDHEGDTEGALARARALMFAHRESAIVHRLLGDLHYACAVRAVCGEGSEDARMAEAAKHLRVARDAFSEARRLVPDCVDIAAALGDAFAASRMYGEAESEYRRAQSILRPVDPAEHNAAYGIVGMYEGCERERDPSYAGERVAEARERARASYARMTVEELVPLAVERVLDVCRHHGATEARRQAKRVAESFRKLGRAQYLHAYMDLEFVRSLDASIDKRAFLRRTLVIAERAAQAFPKSVVIASFHARLLFVLGEYHATERECRRALEMKDPDDPQSDCIPPGSISGENLGARLVSMACEFHELLNKILMEASDYWNSMSTERQRDSFLRVRLDVLQDEYSKVDLSYAFTMSDVRSFVKEHKSWRFWVCPICDGKKFVDTGLLLTHMCSKHPRVVLPRLQSVLDLKLSDKALESDDSLDGITFCQDSDQQDMICFNERNDIFKWLFYAPSSGVGAKPFPEVREKKCMKGYMLLESIKEKMKTLPTDKSTTEFAEALPEIQELWNNFVKDSALDYRGIILALARSFLWRELVKCMTEDLKVAVKWISAADIDAIFANEPDSPDSPAVEEHGSKTSHANKEDQETGDDKQSLRTDGDLKIIDNDQESEVHVEDESSETPANNTELSDPPIKVAESGNDLEAKFGNLEIELKISKHHQESDVHVEVESSETPANNTELSDPPIKVAESGNDLDAEVENLEIDLKISEHHQESEFHVEEGSSQTTAKDTELSDPAINVAGSGNDLGAKLENLQIDPNSGSSVATSEASSSGQDGQQV
ncbi:uncharacterized protein LOC133887297 [Phragmites australis]|uniref:uncharacterized protein LOC133887297 n=1 Tax=Phragmites australis TaxID=29695 RepID=UPI002D78573B|nr:uncharacterized protein LOC133887297 [Phragmites australis]